MIKYIFKEAPVAIKGFKKANPQRIGEALEKIAAEKAGHLTPKAVVETARDAKHVLHRHFEWNDAVAAESYRLDQARSLIRSIKIEDAGTDEPAPAYISIGDKSGTSYRSLSDVLNSVDLQAAALAQAEKDLRAFESRYRQFTEICDVVRQAREKIASRRTKHESRPHA